MTAKQRGSHSMTRQTLRVALDVKDKATNGFLLKRLERDSE